jgi:hypothetical protein
MGKGYEQTTQAVGRRREESAGRSDRLVSGAGERVDMLSEERQRREFEASQDPNAMVEKVPGTAEGRQ